MTTFRAINRCYTTFYTYGSHEIKLQDNYMKTEFAARNNQTFQLQSTNFQGIKANKLSTLSTQAEI